jgi:hypothetical protein
MPWQSSVIELPRLRLETIPSEERWDLPKKREQTDLVVQRGVVLDSHGWGWYTRSTRRGDPFPTLAENGPIKEDALWTSSE